MDFVLFGVLLVIGVAVYFLPLIIAGARERLVGPVFVLNLFLGWTLLGWVVAMVMAVTERSAKEEERFQANKRATRAA